MYVLEFAAHGNKFFILFILWNGKININTWKCKSFYLVPRIIYQNVLWLEVDTDEIKIFGYKMLPDFNLYLYLICLFTCSEYKIQNAKEQPNSIFQLMLFHSWNMRSILWFDRLWRRTLKSLLIVSFCTSLKN